MTDEERKILEWLAAESEFILRLAQVHRDRLLQINAIRIWEERDDNGKSE